MIGVGLWHQLKTLSPTPITPSQAVHYQCLLGVQARLQDISFPAVHDPDGGDDVPLSLSSIVAWKTPLLYYREDLTLTLPAIVITPQTEETNPNAGVTDRDDYGRPCMVTIVMADNMEPTLQINLDIMALWREKIMHAFQNQRLSGASAVWRCEVRSAPAFIPAGWGKQLLSSAILLKFVTREPRGLT